MNHRILIVEDDLYIRESLRDLLEDEGHDVECAENGAIGLARLATMPVLPDLIMLDLMMPVKDGFQFRAEQQADPRLADIPVVVLSADPQLEAWRPQLGAASYLRKPIDIDALLSVAAA